MMSRGQKKQSIPTQDSGAQRVTPTVFRPASFIAPSAGKKVALYCCAPKPRSAGMSRVSHVRCAGGEWASSTRPARMKLVLLSARPHAHKQRECVRVRVRVRVCVCVRVRRASRACACACARACVI